MVNFRLILIGGLSAATISACAPSYKMSAADASTQAGYGYSQSAYGYETSNGYASSYGYESGQTAATPRRSRYGAELRGGCEIAVQPCGMMSVVPVYPVYQYVTPPAPEVQTVEVPQTYEPEPVPYVEPIPYVEPTPYVEPVYEPPVHHWPEPKTPVPDWKPLRK